MQHRASPIDPSELFQAQRVLRDRLLRGGRKAEVDRDLAAQMLLFLDDPKACWSICAQWLLARTGADRVDGGFSRSADRVYEPAMERLAGHLPLPSVLGASMDARDRGIALVWASRNVVIFSDVVTDPRIGSHMRDLLGAAGTRSKLAVALRDGGREVGLLCADRSRAPGWSDAAYLALDNAAREVLGPVLGAVQRIGGADDAGPLGAASTALPFTPAEWRVAQLVLEGCSYKEIARRLDRSCSTVDHQLRSMRDKLGVKSTAKLMRELAAHLPGAMSAGTARRL